jgi:uncharacterized protein YggT (Ycf19 family)
VTLIDFILNVAGVLLWLNYRGIRFDPLVRTSAASLAGTLKRAEVRKRPRWPLPLWLLGLLLFRGWLYHQIGPEVRWMPRIDLTPIPITLRSDLASRMLIFSFLSFLLTLGIVYVWLLLLSLLHRRNEQDPILNSVRLHLGFADRLPVLIRLALPLICGVLAWLGLSYLLEWMRVLPPPGSFSHRAQQAVLVGVGAYLHWKTLLGLLLLLFVLNSYIYLGTHSFWNFINSTGRNFLTPFRLLPLQAGRIDFSPVLALGVVFLLGEMFERGLASLFRHLPF